MNIADNITKFIDSKNYDDFTKIRFIYLYVCNKFSYDTRFMYANPELKSEIYNKKVDITNVNDFEQVCYAYAHILKDALSLYGYNAEIMLENNSKFSHAYVIVKYKDYYLKLDPTKRHDTTRVKMRSTTLDFTSLSDDTFFMDELFLADVEILNDIKHVDTNEFYNNKTINKLVKTIEIDAINRNLSKEELFLNKIYYLFSLINTRTDFKKYDDIDYYLSYLIKKLKINDPGQIYIKPALFFKKDNKTMKDLVNIIYIKYPNLQSMFYLIKKEGKNFQAKEIYQDEAKEILSEYVSPVCQFYFEQLVNEIPKDEIKGLIV